jgi:predicted nucleic acid-binding Zn ribbon protein
MPEYNYECEKCEKQYGIDQSMTENFEEPPTHCPDCDPECKKEGTLFRSFSNARCAFNLKGAGYYKPGWN